MPDVWQAAGDVSGLRARGGFEVERVEWKNGKIAKAIIKSNLGGNLRLRVPNEVKMSNGKALNKAIGENSNPFYRTEKTPVPIVSPKAPINTPQLKATWLYDMATQKGKEYTIVGD